MIFAPQGFKNYAYVDNMDERILLKPGATTHAALMTRDDLAFLVGVLDEAKPEKVLEMGVAAGATTALILDVLDKQGQNAFLHSMDLSDRYFQDQTKATGYLVDEIHPELKDRWRLHTGAPIPRLIDAIGGGVDLLILDTVHSLPGELIDFPVVLPYLKDGAWVILHDINLYSNSKKPEFATKVLLDTVVGEKIITPELHHGKEHLPNIGAFRITPDTRKYIVNCFSALAMPWEYLPSQEDYGWYKTFFAKHYDEEMVKLLDLAYEQNARRVHKKNKKKEPPLHRLLRHLKTKQF